MNHDDGNNTENMLESDIVLIGVGRTSKTQLQSTLQIRTKTSYSFSKRNEYSDEVVKSKKLCIVGLTTEAEDYLT